MNRRGLTLVEVLVALVVVAVVLLLVFMALPERLFPSRRPTKQECSGNLRNFGLQMAIYANDHGSFPTGPETNEGRLGLLHPLYADNILQFNCPGAHRRGSEVVEYDAETDRILNSDYYLDGWIPPGIDPTRAVMGDFNKDGMNHEGGSNILFADGHVEWVEMDDAGRHPNPHLPDIDPDIYANDARPIHKDDANLERGAFEILDLRISIFDLKRSRTANPRPAGICYLLPESLRMRRKREFMART